MILNAVRLLLDCFWLVGLECVSYAFDCFDFYSIACRLRFADVDCFSTVLDCLWLLFNRFSAAFWNAFECSRLLFRLF